MKKKSKPMKPWLQILLGVIFMLWGGGSLIYQMQPGVIGLKSIPILLLLAGIVNLYIGIKRNNDPQKDAKAKTHEEAIDLALNIPNKTTALEVSDEIKKGAIYPFLLKSYEAWRDGVFDDFSDYYKKAATKDSPEVLTGLMVNDPSYAEFLEVCFKARKPEAEEYLYTIFPSDFMMTNTFLYLNTRSKNGQLHCIPLCNIKAYTNQGLWVKRGTLTLTDGKEIAFKLDAVPDETKLRQLQEALRCKELIDI